MKFFVNLIFMMIFVSVANANGPCQTVQPDWPILASGRVMPLQLHASEVLKFITGQTTLNTQTATTIYCMLSHGQIPEGFLISVPHLDMQKLLSITTSKILLKDLEPFLPTLTTLVAQDKTNADKSTLATERSKLLTQYQLTQSILEGMDWTIPVLKEQNNSEVEWVTFNELQLALQHAPHGLLPTEFARDSCQIYAEKISHKHKTEYKLFQAHFFDWSFLLAFVTLLLVYSFSTQRSLAFIGAGLTLASMILGIAARVYIAERGPVTNMYETVMWVGFGALVFGTWLYFYHREKTFLLSGLVLLILCLFMMRFSSNMLDPNIKPLVPVLRDNFWLSTHVTCITISYAALALSWILANSYMLAKIFNKKVDLLQFQNRIYACLKIGIVLLALGIILGGIWADYSWGRFWGWDPKETWALIALLCYIVILHSRFSGWINSERFIIAVALAFLSIIMAWFGVNYILASGLHSYGFSNGGAVFIVTLVLLQLMLLGVYLIKSFKINRI